MKSFKDFNITPMKPGLVGDKIKLERVLNREIIVNDYRIVQSNFPEKGNGKRLDLAITIGDTPHVLFTSSINLQEAIQQIPREGFPFKTTIIKQDRLEFT